jgi:hypothetical protein
MGRVVGFYKRHGKTRPITERRRLIKRMREQPMKVVFDLHSTVQGFGSNGSIRKEDIKKLEAGYTVVIASTGVATDKFAEWSKDLPGLKVCPHSTSSF